MPEHSRLTSSDFPSFYLAVHGVEPFPWQSDLVTTVLGEGRWPDLIDVPTGLGKTSMLDVTVFVAAATANVPGAARLGRRRTFFVVDRRIVVDEAYEHARILADAVAGGNGSDTVLGRVAARLRTHAPNAGGTLLPVTRMRGGTTWDSAWLDRPDRPGIVLGTVDQVGSRLLFRGYGVSDRRKSLDAALVGTDSLILVDEAHLATALLRTVEAAQQRDRLGVPLPGLDVVRLTATGQASDHSYRIDVEAHRRHPVAWRRLTAAKQLVTREASAKTIARDLVQAVTEQVQALTGIGAPVALVVCNTINRAREVHSLLAKTLTDADVELLIGRSRPLDRADLQDRILTTFGVDREPAVRPAVLVATQTVEVGVNLDADVMVTESASWDAIVQRLGRLNRLGTFTTRFPDHTAAPAVVVHDGQADGPIYGAARDATWAWLVENAPDEGVDMSPLACRDLTAQFAELGLSVARQPQDVPVLLGPTLDAWAQTAPIPLNNPPVAPYLHGFDAGTAPVQVLWRDGLVVEHADGGLDELVDPFDDPLDDFLDDAEIPSKQVDALLTLWPARSGEIVEVPFGAARRWIGGLGSGPVADLDGVEESEPRTAKAGAPFRVLAQRVTGDDALSWQWIAAERLRPGDRIVVPSQRGGLDQYGWAPDSTTHVVDISEAATFTPSRSRRDSMLRLDPGMANRLGISETDAIAAAVADPNDDAVLIAAALAAHLPDTAPPRSGWDSVSWPNLRAWLDHSTLRIVEVTDPTDAWVPGEEPRAWLCLLVGPLPAARTEEQQSAMAEGDDDEVAASSVGGGPVTLDRHHFAVGTRADAIAEALTLPEELRTVVVDAARWHDLGKNDPRFQAMLHGGDAAEAAIAPEPLAKSGMDPSDRLAWRRAARLSGLPAGARHEAWSAALIEAHLVEHSYPGDADLLIHLVASHHGYARPWPRLVIDDDPRLVVAVVDGKKITVSSEHTVALDQPGRFARLNQRYGRWGLALLESVVRAADVTVSGEGS